MMFFKRLFGRKEKPPPEPMRGSPTPQTEAQQQATRERMEAGMAADRERLAATESQRADEPSEGQDAKSSGSGNERAILFQ